MNTWVLKFSWRPSKHNAKASSCMISSLLGWDSHEQFGCMSRHGFPNMFPRWSGFLPDGVAEWKHLKVLAQLPGPSHEWRVLHFCFSIVLPYSHVYTNMLPEHRDAIHWGLWAQYMYFNGLEEAPNLTTGRPLWAVGCWEISVKSHQGFTSFFPCHNFFLVLRGTRGTVG